MNTNGVPSTRTPLHLVGIESQVKHPQKPARKAKEKRTVVSQEEYVAIARQAEALMRKQGSLMLEAARLLGVAQDFSPATLLQVRAVLDNCKEVQVQCKRVEEITLKRGHAFYDEQKAKLNEGTLKLARRNETELDSE